MIIKEYELKRLREKYRPGTRVRLVYMDDPYRQMAPGSLGTVTGVDDIGTIHVNWDDGGSLGVAWGEDKCEPVAELTDRDCEEICSAWSTAGFPGSDGNIRIHSNVPATGVYNRKGEAKSSVSIVERDGCKLHVYASEVDIYNAWVEDWLREEASRCELSPEYVRELFDDMLSIEMCSRLAEMYSNAE